LPRVSGRRDASRDEGVKIDVLYARDDTYGERRVDRISASETLLAEAGRESRE